MLLTETAEASRRFSFPSESLKLPADQVKSIFKQMVKQVGPKEANTAMAALWFIRVESFRQQEEKFLLEGKYESCLDDHRAMLMDIIADGEAVVLGSKKYGLGENQWGFNIEDLVSTLNSLHSDFNCEHGPKNSGKTNALIENIFNGAES